MNSPTLVIIIVDDKTVTRAHVIGLKKTKVEVYGEQPVKLGLLALVGANFFLDFEYSLWYSVMLRFLQH